jgi:hypothetical protein
LPFCLAEVMKENMNQKECLNTKKFNIQLKKKKKKSFECLCINGKMLCLALLKSVPHWPPMGLWFLCRERERNIVCEWSLFVSMSLETLRGTSEPVIKPYNCGTEKHGVLTFTFIWEDQKIRIKRTIWFLSLSLFCVDNFFEIFMGYKYWSAVL